ncbi:hypothetical protein V8F06_002815 [Rhypophila decipiens]
MSSPQQSTTLICPRCGRPTTGVNPCVCGETEVRLPSIRQVLGNAYTIPVRRQELPHSDVPRPPGPSFATPAPPRQPPPPRQQGSADYHHGSNHNPRQSRYDSSPARHNPQYRERSASPARELSEARRSPLTRRSRPAFAPLAPPPPPPVPPLLEAQAAGAPRPAPALAAPEPEPWVPFSDVRGTRDLPPPPPPPRRAPLRADEAPPVAGGPRSHLPPAWVPRPSEAGHPVAGVTRGSTHSRLTVELERRRIEQRDRNFIADFAVRVEREHQPKLGFRNESTKTACHKCVANQRKCTMNDVHPNCCDQCWKDKVECTWPSDARPRSRRPGPGDGPGGSPNGSDDDDEAGVGPAPVACGTRGRGRPRGRPRGRGRGQGRATAAAA